jgi:gluconolactonase
MITEDFEVRDARFERLILGNVRVETLARGCRWAEGPVHVPAARHLLWSDIPNDRVMRYDEITGAVGVFEQPARCQNGHTLDRQGRVIACEHRARRVTRREHDGSLTALAERWRGKRLNSPNDVVQGPDGAIWFTDPTYGIDSDYEGDAAESEIGGSWLWRLSPERGLEPAAQDFAQPNGLAFGPDGRLYVADTGATHVKDGPRHIRVFDLDAGGALSGGDVFATCEHGLFDGFRFDALGNLWTSAGDGVHVYAADGALIGKVRCDEVVANVEFGGPRRNRLFICATTTLRAVYVRTRGLRHP